MTKRLFHALVVRVHRIERCIIWNVIRFFRIRRETEKVARGFALGLMTNFFPTFGFGVVVAAFLARLIRGNVIAGAIGGVSLSLIWPVLFYLNVQTGSLFVHPVIPIDDMDDLTERTMRRLLWGPAFTIGAILNGIAAAVISYVIILLFYEQVRPIALRYFRRHSREHQRRFRRWRHA